MITTILMILAVIISPMIAVQVEKYLEKKGSVKERKLNVFKTLMATRGRLLDPHHVEALNMIDLEFDGEKAVTDSWKAYLDHFINMPKYHTTEDEKESEKIKYDSAMTLWNDKQENYLADLLYNMGKSLNYKFDKIYIKRSIYSPQGHIDIENEQQLLRKALIGLLMGKLVLPVETRTTLLSSDELKVRKEEEAEQKLIRELLIKHYKGEIPSIVKIVTENNDKGQQV